MLQSSLLGTPFNIYAFFFFKALLLSEDNKDEINVDLLDDAALTQMRKIKVSNIKSTIISCAYLKSHCVA